MDSQEFARHICFSLGIRRQVVSPLLPTVHGQRPRSLVMEIANLCSALSRETCWYTELVLLTWNYATAFWPNGDLTSTAFPAVYQCHIAHLNNLKLAYFHPTILIITRKHMGDSVIKLENMVMKELWRALLVHPGVGLALPGTHDQYT